MWPAKQMSARETAPNYSIVQNFEKKIALSKY